MNRPVIWTSACTIIALVGLMTACDDSDVAAPAESTVTFDHLDPTVHPTVAAVIIPDAEDATKISAASATENAGSLHLSVTPDGRPPRRIEEVGGGNAVFGYAWVDLDTGEGVAATIHPSFSDSRQNPHGWHTHIVGLGAGAGAANFCLLSASANSPGGIGIADSGVKVNISKTQAGGLSAGDLDAAAAFVVVGEALCPAPNLGVILTDDPIGL